MRLGLNRKPWVKTSLAPGSQVVTAYLEKAGLQDDLDKIGFNLVGYGCTTCIGNSGPIQAGSVQGHRGWRSGRHVRPVGQPQLRRPDQPGRTRQLPGLAAAGGGLCAGGHDGHRPDHRPDWAGQGRQRRLPQGHLAQSKPRDRGTGRANRDRAMFEEKYADVFTGDEKVAGR